MRRLTAMLCIAALLAHTAPALARRAHPEPVPTDEQISAVSNPCELTSKFTDIKARIKKIGILANDAGATVSRIRHTSRSHPYKQVEYDWEKVGELANPALDALSDIPIALDESPDGPKKKASLALVRSYQKTIEDLVDYAHYSVNYERSENMLSMNFAQDQLSFGVYYIPTTAAGNNIISRRFTSANGKAHNALLSMQLPEHRYAVSCSIPSSPLAPPVQTIADPCELNEPLIAIRETVRHMEEEAKDAGNTALRLRQTSRWRPYKRIELEWTDVSSSAQSSSTILTEIALALDGTPAGPKKEAAQELLAADQNAIDRLTSYTQGALGVERTQNFLSMNIQRSQITFGVSKQAGKTTPDNAARQEFNEKYGEPDNVDYMLRIPEYHYARICKPF